MEFLDIYFQEAYVKCSLLQSYMFQSQGLSLEIMACITPLEGDSKSYQLISYLSVIVCVSLKESQSNMCECACLLDMYMDEKLLLLAS